MQRISRRSGVQAGQARRTSSLSALLFPRRGTGRQTDRRRGRRAFTLAELLVCLGVAGLLMSLILPAIQQTRESARQTQCRNNLRQLGLACQEHVAAHGGLPAFEAGLNAGVHPPRDSNISVHVALLSFLDQENVARRIVYPQTHYLASYAPPISFANSTIQLITIPVFRCPSDAGVPAGAIHYRANRGWGNYLVVQQRGPFANFRRLTPQEISDGLSQTALMAEVLPGDQNVNVYTPQRDTILEPDSSRLENADGSYRDYTEVCLGPFRRDYRTAPWHDSYGGSTWLFGAFDQTLYSHDLPPNSRIPNCGAAGYSGSISAVASRSVHAGGHVNLVLADGAVRKFPPTVDLSVWRAISTRAGREGLAMPD